MKKIFLHTYGYLHFEKTAEPGSTYTAFIENYSINDTRAFIKITSDILCEQTIEKIDAVLKLLEKMHIAARQAYLDDFNDEEERIYISNIYKKILTEADYLLLRQLASAEEQLLLAVSLISVDIDLRNENISTLFTYMKGYELAHKYKFAEDCEQSELILQTGPCIMKEQLSALIDIRELPVMNEVCSRFRKDWQNYPLKSYFIYLMARRIKNFLKTVNTINA